MKELKSYRDVIKAISEGHEVEWFYSHYSEWLTLKNLAFNLDLLDNTCSGLFRIKPSKPSINWEHVSEELNYLAEDKNGGAFLYKDRPSIDGRCKWIAQNLDLVNAKRFSSFKAGNCYWKDSLVERPKE